MNATRSAVLSVLILFSSLGAHAAETMCGTSAEHDEYLRSVLNRPRDRQPVAAHAVAAPVLRDGFFHIAADEEILPGNRPFSLAGQSLVFEPRSATTFAVRREPLRYSEPAGSPVREFETEPEVYERNLGFELSIFGRSTSRLYITRFNTVHLDPPPSTFGGAQIDEVRAAVQRGTIISPLMIAAGKPRQLAYPSLYVEETASSITLTWRSTEGSTFGYDVQAELHQDGGVIFSYRTPRNMAWGTPILSAGFDPASARRDLLRSFSDAVGDVSAGVTPQVRAMADIISTEVARVDGTDLLSVRMKLAGPVSTSHLISGQSIEYRMRLDGELALISITPFGQQIISFGAPPLPVSDTQAVRIDGDTIEFFAIQRAPATSATRGVHVQTQVRPQTSVRDTSTFSVTLDPAPALIASDLSAISQSRELSLPITQPFLLAPFNPYSTWNRVKSTFPISDHEIDGVAMYQTFYTDMIFYAGAYATGGNAQVDGIAPFWPEHGLDHPRSPTLLHMNQLTYNYSAEPLTASKLLLHEFGHRWLYFFSIRENGVTSQVLNPTGGHPAAYVHTPAAFPVYGAEDASVMGGAYFRPESSGSWRTVSNNNGYSWTDLYLMGLAAPEEVTPWFYLANTNPLLPNAYWPPNDITVTGQRRDVAIGQILDVHGPRSPSAGLSQRQFRVLFVLVTEPGREPTAEEIAKLNEWRALLEHNFALATGGRGSIRTSFVQPSRKRATR
jgi:hypothetical protein